MAFPLGQGGIPTPPAGAHINVPIAVSTPPPLKEGKELSGVIREPLHEISNVYDPSKSNHIKEEKKVKSKKALDGVNLVSHTNRPLDPAEAKFRAEHPAMSLIISTREIKLQEVDDYLARMPSVIKGFDEAILFEHYRPTPKEKAAIIASQDNLKELLSTLAKNLNEYRELKENARQLTGESKLLSEQEMSQKFYAITHTQDEIKKTIKELTAHKKNIERYVEAAKTTDKKYVKFANEKLNKVIDKFKSLEAYLKKSNKTTTNKYTLFNETHQEFLALVSSMKALSDCIDGTFGESTKEFTPQEAAVVENFMAMSYEDKLQYIKQEDDKITAGLIRVKKNFFDLNPNANRSISWNETAEMNDGLRRKDSLRPVPLEDNKNTRSAVKRIPREVNTREMNTREMKIDKNKPVDVN